ncbi:hypothetical protein HZU73_06536 [Apis mellifera caucasica]|uniref:Uncharacterized protein LOC551426 n=1 Tax=Apis mellifera TaxID=7460 RepID=A0A7M7R7J2_APIME|nr:uncharacterized protein LOC551426 [Apis mellifera]KAG6798067.1 hypothetical protein HZU73_06536 [Apis mellifera caucasica]KAG9429902.1 hypothetical protein HZU67_08183 [Apis mellifera carnica]|eukprot:XP_623821.1 uncharacterized protein LOC551426 [Apis mellifera]
MLGYENESDLIKNRMNLIKEWEPQNEVWFLRHGNKIIAGVGIINGMIINSIFRRKLKLYHHGALMTTLFVTLAPSSTSYLSHQFFILNKILVREPYCLICEELKAISFLQVNSLLYSLVIAPTINIGIAGNIGYRVPYIKEGKELFKLWWSVVKPHSKIISFLFITNTIAGGLVTYLQILSMQNLTNIILRLQEYIDNK